MSMAAKPESASGELVSIVVPSHGGEHDPVAASLKTKAGGRDGEQR